MSGSNPLNDHSNALFTGMHQTIDLSLDFPFALKGVQCKGTEIFQSTRVSTHISLVVHWKADWGRALRLIEKLISRNCFPQLRRTHAGQKTHACNEPASKEATARSVRFQPKSSSLRELESACNPFPFAFQCPNLDNDHLRGRMQSFLSGSQFY